MPAAGGGRIFYCTDPPWEGSIGGLGYARDGAFSGRILVSPPDVQRIADMEARMRAMTAHALAHDISMLVATLPSWLFALFDRMTIAPRAAWPRLALAAVWCSGASSLHLPRLREALGDVPLRDVGVAASEGYFAMSIGPTVAALPMAGEHVFEFVDEATVPTAGT